VGSGLVSRVGSTRLVRLPPQRPGPLAPLPHPCLAAGRQAFVRRILEQTPDGASVPEALDLGRGNPLLLQPTTDVTDLAPLPTDPGDDLPHHLGLLRDHLIRRLAGPLAPADVAVTIGRASQDIARTPTCRVQLAPAAAFEDLGTLVLGNHALDLQQQI